MDSIDDKLRARGWREEYEEGRQEERREFLLHLLRVRFGELPEAAVARVNAADYDQLKRWIEPLLYAPTLEAVLAHE